MSSMNKLKSIREQGIDGIVNLCGEYCDLHQIEKDYGFEVYYLPVQDNEAPSLQETEKALQWLDEAVYLGKKILIHCTLGIGRTGTFMTSYFLRRGFSPKLAKQNWRRLALNRQVSTQWWFLRKFRKKEGKLTIREPSLEGSRLVNLGSVFRGIRSPDREGRGEFQILCRSPSVRQGDRCLLQPLLQPRTDGSSSSQPLNEQEADERRSSGSYSAGRGGAKNGLRPFAWEPDLQFRVGANEEMVRSLPDQRAALADYRCPLSVDRKCIAFPYRPMICRVYGMPAVSSYSSNRLSLRLHDLSKRLFFELNGTFMGEPLLFPLTTVVSGKFVQDYFNFITREKP